ncbi:hypothetical protein C8Q74DRAFT_1222660 [Fomes fomentarius]|nr:hypothetical protein C8Q74DRAFT_1222660 [Fomes fomentarius]
MLELDRPSSEVEGKDRDWNQPQNNLKTWPRNGQPTPSQPPNSTFIFAELKWAASHSDKTTGIHATSVCGFPSYVTESLVRAVAVLDLFYAPKGDQPMSSGPLVQLTWDVYVQGRKDLQEARWYTETQSLSTDSQWLPTDFAVTAVTGEHRMCISSAGKYTHNEIKSFFDPNGANPPTFTYPHDHLFRLSGYVDAAGLANPYLMDENGNAGFIVSKYGQSTDLTFGRFSELEAYTCDEFGHESWEVAVLNFSRKHGNFSGKGDSGAAIFNAEGKLVAILHSGMRMSNHVTFGTPGHYVVELVKEHYPDADFDRLKFDA